MLRVINSFLIKGNFYQLIDYILLAFRYTILSSWEYMYRYVFNMK